MGLSKRQRAYRQYLTSDHWIELREQALSRDGGKCVCCGSDFRIQVHHTCYRGRYEDSLLEDLETLCRECRSEEHGFGPTEFDIIARKLKRGMDMSQRGSPELWKALKRELIDDNDMEEFASLMFCHVLFIWAHEGKGPDWYTNDKDSFDLWRQRAFRVRRSPWERITDEDVRKTL